MAAYWEIITVGGTTFEYAKRENAEEKFKDLVKRGGNPILYRVCSDGDKILMNPKNGIAND